MGTWLSRMEAESQKVGPQLWKLPISSLWKMNQCVKETFIKCGQSRTAIVNLLELSKIINSWLQHMCHRFATIGLGHATGMQLNLELLAEIKYSCCSPGIAVTCMDLKLGLSELSGSRSPWFPSAGLHDSQVCSWLGGATPAFHNHRPGCRCCLSYFFLRPLPFGLQSFLMNSRELIFWFPLWRCMFLKACTVS